MERKWVAACCGNERCDYGNREEYCSTCGEYLLWEKESPKLQYCLCGNCHKVFRIQYIKGQKYLAIDYSVYGNTKYVWREGHREYCDACGFKLVVPTEIKGDSQVFEEEPEICLICLKFVDRKLIYKSVKYNYTGLCLCRDCYPFYKGSDECDIPILDQRKLYAKEKATNVLVVICFILMWIFLVGFYFRYQDTGLEAVPLFFMLVFFIVTCIIWERIWGY